LPDQLHLVLLFLGGVLGGMINVLAGGAGFMTFPLLLAAGLTEMQANAANFVALFPANVVGTVVYRREIRTVREHLVTRLILAAAGGILGSLLFVWLGAEVFKRVIPWLLVFATLSFALGPSIKTWLERHQDFDVSRWLWLSFALEFLVYLYGGYFGLGMGIILLAIHSIFSHMTIHQAQALRNGTIALMTAISISVFAFTGLIPWFASFVMMAGVVVGGYVMAHIARRMPHDVVRTAILCWSVVMTAIAFWRYS
jgi:uncharacterized membrane protein YfcA